MRPPERWPLHPAPAETESLSSWLRRIAASYGMYSYELLEHGLGHRELSDPDLNLNPPMHLLEELAKRTGLDQHRVSAMTMAGWVPWLFDSLDLAPDAYETYVHQLSVLLPPKRRNIYTPRKWLPWLPEAGARRGCPDCLEFSPALLLVWQLPVIASCPVHWCRLETYEGHPPDYIRWTTPAHDQRPLPKSLSLMDRRTWQAITTGSVDLPGIRYTPASGSGCCGPSWTNSPQPKEDMAGNWTTCAVSGNTAVTRSGRPIFVAAVRDPTLDRPAAAARSNRRRDGTDRSRLTDRTGNLRTPPQARTKPPNQRRNPRGPLTATAGAQEKPTLDELLKQATDALDACIAAAKEDPVVAKQLFDFARYGCRGDQSLRVSGKPSPSFRYPRLFVTNRESTTLCMT
ncbi:TniQ family protein [Arthrobacter crystallopoietes]|uniref:TniQ protein n=1 Tax=Crystallibacter crystallopoietes TaxID=37928 RepID=A0A1H0XLX4_9MICC|nr:TniQ protein [Arthrobacter crystallopoietes]